MTRAQRDARIIRCRREYGWTYQRIADHFGLASRQRAWQIVTKGAAVSDERHPVTVKVWEWFEHDERALSYSPELRAAIQARIEDLDRELHYFDWQIVTKAGKA